MDVVVVLPWVPAMATPCLSRISSASISARGMTGTAAASAARTSGLSSCTALERTTTSACPTFSGRWPMCTTAPSERSRCTLGPSFWSEPVT